MKYSKLNHIYHCKSRFDFVSGVKIDLFTWISLDDLNKGRSIKNRLDVVIDSA